MIGYHDVETFTREGLTGLGYGAENPDVAEPARTMPFLQPGPITSEQLQKMTPQSVLFLQVGNGVGLTTEGLYDKPFITVRAIGMQSNYDSAEKLAFDVDKLFLADVPGPFLMGGARVLYVTRTGGAPQLVDFDSANRYHFQATYITEAQR
jgi:hypothetical protein